MEKFFKLKEHGTNTRTEIVAGVTTFLAMAYILAVNPSMLAEAGMDSGAVFTATAVSAAFATLIMAFYANYPVALASGMGLNAYFAYTVSVSYTHLDVYKRQAFVMPMRAALAAEYAASQEAPTCPHIEEIKMMFPAFSCSMCGMACFAHKKAARTSTENRSSHSPADISVNRH